MYRRLAHGRLERHSISGALMVAIASPVSAQLVVYDAATTARNTVTAAVKQYLFETERQQHMKLREMARRIERPDQPEEIRHGGCAAMEDAWRRLLLRAAIQRCADLRRSSGSAFIELSQRLLADASLLDRLDPAARRLVRRGWRP